ncbi:MAG: hypothetical protein QXW65_01710 [Candidatus Pacearchaeota archaeon]
MTYCFVLRALRDNTGKLYHPDCGLDLKSFYWFTISNKFSESGIAKLIIGIDVKYVDLSQINEIVLEATKEQWNEKKTLEAIISRAIKQAKS